MLIQELRTIQTIASERSISKASGKLHISQPSLSQFLKNYENALGYKLFTRTSEGVEPTLAGQTFLTAAYRITEIYDQLENDLHNIDSMERGQIIFGTPSYRASFVIPTAIEQFRRIYPNVDVDIVEASSKQLESLVTKGRVSAALVLGSNRYSNIRTHYVAREEVFLCAHQSSKVCAHARPSKTRKGFFYININDMLHEKFILLEKGRYLRELADELFSEAGAMPKASIANSVSLALSLAEKNLGVAFCSQLYVQPNSNLRYLSLSDDGIYRNLNIIYPGKYEITDIVSALCGTITTVVQQLLKRNEMLLSGGEGMNVG